MGPKRTTAAVDDVTTTVFTEDAFSTALYQQSKSWPWLTNTKEANEIDWRGNERTRKKEYAWKENQGPQHVPGSIESWIDKIFLRICNLPLERGGCVKDSIATFEKQTRQERTKRRRKKEPMKTLSKLPSSSRSASNNSNYLKNLNVTWKKLRKWGEKREETWPPRNCLRWEIFLWSARLRTVP